MFFCTNLFKCQAELCQIHLYFFQLFSAVLLSKLKKLAWTHKLERKNSGKNDFFKVRKVRECHIWFREIQQFNKKSHYLTVSCNSVSITQESQEFRGRIRRTLLFQSGKFYLGHGEVRKKSGKFIWEPWLFSVGYLCVMSLNIWCFYVRRRDCLVYSRFIWSNSANTLWASTDMSAHALQSKCLRVDLFISQGTWSAFPVVVFKRMHQRCKF